MTDIVYLSQPVGTLKERSEGIIWGGAWFDATGFARRYRIGAPNEAIHTGADLNLNYPVFDSDKLMPVYAIGAGEVVHAVKLSAWGNIIVIAHELENNAVVYARYAHVDTLEMVKVGSRVKEGDQISRIGNAFGTLAYHLHFDLSFTEALRKHPGDWPKLDLKRLLRDYADPRVTLQARSRPIAVSVRQVEVTAVTLNIRSAPSVNATSIGKLKRGELVNILNNQPIDYQGHLWVRIATPPYNQWIASDYTR